MPETAIANSLCRSNDPSRGASVLKLGTRPSLLARAQSDLVARALARKTGATVELVAIESRGDRDRTTSLRQIADADFFNAELDRALLAGDVDFTVHSYKDLSTQRPSGIVTAAIPMREDPRDALLLHPRSDEKLRTGKPLLIGSSSERRHRHWREFLSWAIPRHGPTPEFEFTDLRGPVDDRIQQLFVSRADRPPLDGVVLAVAGLSRLYQDAAGRQAIAENLSQVRWVIAPLSECPTAPGQGALALECRRDDESTRTLLGELHDQRTDLALRSEGAVFEQHDDNQGLGVTAVHHDALGLLRFSKYQNTTRLDCVLPAQPDLDPTSRFDGSDLSASFLREPLPLQGTEELQAAYVAHWRALKDQPWSSHIRTWTAGIPSWRRLSATGIWVEGCTEHLGFEQLWSVVQNPVFGLPPLKDWLAITHDQAVPSWDDSGIGRATAGYRLRIKQVPQTIREQARSANYYFWSSPQQFAALKEDVNRDAHHASGPGKTYQFLKAQGLKVDAFPHREVWRQWLS